MYINNIRNSQQDSNADGITYGYIRVSTVAQHDDRQRIAMEEFGITADHIFADKQSGKDFDRPAYNELMARLSPNDTLVVKSLDRLGRSYEEMIHQLDIITHEKGAFIVVLDLPILDSRNKYGDDLTAKLVLNLVIQIFSYVAQMEREMNHRRTMEGIAAAKSRGYSSAGSLWSGLLSSSPFVLAGRLTRFRHGRQRGSWGLPSLPSAGGQMNK